MEGVFRTWFRRYAGHKRMMEPGGLVEMMEDVESEFGKGFCQGPGTPEWFKELVTDPEDPAYQRISKDEFLEMMVEIGTAEGTMSHMMTSSRRRSSGLERMIWRSIDLENRKAMT